MTSALGRWLSSLYGISVGKRAIVIWLLFQAVLWIIFGIGYASHPGVYTSVSAQPPAAATVGGWLTTLLFIVGSNALIVLSIAVGNLFVRFGPITPGLLILVIQGVTIGWLAGTNGFEVPFTNLATANAQFLRVGLWETTAYALACAITLPKSLLVANRFPAKDWQEVHKLTDLRFSVTERLLGVLVVITLVGAAIVETNYLIGG